MAVLSTSTAVSDNEAIAPNLERLLHIACFSSRVPIALLIVQQASICRVISQVGWSLEQSLEPLAELLCRAVQTGSSQGLSVVQEVASASSFLTHQLPAFLPPFQFWAGVSIQDSRGQQRGALLVLDTVPHQLLPPQIDTLQLLAQSLASALLVDTPVSEEAPATTLVLPNNTDIQGIAVNLNLPVLPYPFETTVHSLQEESRRLQLLQNLSFALQVCESLDEVYTTLPDLLYPFRVDLYGQVLLTNVQQNRVLKVIRWGTSPHAMPPDCRLEDCPVVHSYQFCTGCAGNETLTARPTVCPSVSSGQDSAGACRFCAPIITLKGHSFGVLSFWHPVLGGRISEADQRSIVAIAQHIALTLERLCRIETLQNQSIRDPLTGLFNRLYLKEMLPQLLHRAEHNRQPISAIMVDIDHFKRFNDQYGHQAGDQVLRDFSVFLKGFVRATDFACRYGGEEFLLILPEVPQLKAHQVAERIRQGLQYVTMRFAGQDLGHVTLSAGVATFPQHGRADEELIAAADIALYCSKARGRNRVTVAESRSACGRSGGVNWSH